MVKLYNIDTYPDVLLDSTVIKDEKFQLEGTRTFEYPKYCRLVVDMTPDEPDQRKKTLKAYRFFADNTAMEFQCQMDSMPAYYWEAVNKEHNVTLTGSPTQDLYQAYKTSVQELSERKTAGWYRRPSGAQALTNQCFVPAFLLFGHRQSTLSGNETPLYPRKDNPNLP